MSQDFWQQISIYCNHLAPVAGPLVQKLGETAGAVHAAQEETRMLEGRIEYFRSIQPGDD